MLRLLLQQQVLLQPVPQRELRRVFQQEPLRVLPQVLLPGPRQELQPGLPRLRELQQELQQALQPERLFQPRSQWECSHRQESAAEPVQLPRRESAAGPVQKLQPESAAELLQSVLR